LRSLYRLDAPARQFVSLPYAGKPISLVAPRNGGSVKMPDLVMLTIGLGYFALAIVYAFICERV
jgi:hypothetical protein